jgi:hypothetical protein
MSGLQNRQIIIGVAAILLTAAALFTLTYRNKKKRPGMRLSSKEATGPEWKKGLSGQAKAGSDVKVSEGTLLEG